MILRIVLQPTEKRYITVFICIDWFYPAYKAGGPVQSVVNMVNSFNDKRVRYKIFCSDMDLDGTVLKGITTDRWVQFNECTEVWYASKNTRHIKSIRAETAAAKADVLFVNGIYSWMFNIVPLLFCRIPRKIISVRGMLHPGALSQKSFKKKIFIAMWKLTGVHKQYEFHATSVEEERHIRNIFGNSSKIFTAANFPRSFKPLAPYKNVDELKLISVALISPMKNLLLVIQALQNCTYNVSYDIYGPVKDAAYWQLCEAEIKRLPGNIAVTYHGDIHPGKVEHVLQQSHVFILPSKSENFGHSIYEAFTAGKPVITSMATPWNNLQNNKAGINIPVLNAGAIAEAIGYFAVMDRDSFSVWQNAAVEYAGRAVKKEVIMQQYREMFLIQVPEMV